MKKKTKQKKNFLKLKILNPKIWGVGLSKISHWAGCPNLILFHKKCPQNAELVTIS